VVPASFGNAVILRAALFIAGRRISVDTALWDGTPAGEPALPELERRKNGVCPVCRRFYPSVNKLLTLLPAPRISPPMKACEHYDYRFLKFEKHPVRESPHACATKAPVNNWKLQGIIGDGLDRSLNCQGEPLAQFDTHVVVPAPGFLQFRICLRKPDNRKGHGFLNSSDRTFSQEITSEGFCACLAMRESNSAFCASVSNCASASRLSQTASSSSAFSAADRLASWLRRSLIG